MARTQNQPKPAPRRRWVILGPGILLALILGLQVAIANHRASSTPPIVESQVLGGNPATAPAPAEGIPLILNRSEKLKLTDRQVAALRKLQVEWSAQSRPLVREMNRAAAEFQQFMTGTNGKATLSDVRSHAGPVSDLSRQVADLRRSYWQKGLQVLDSRQRDVLSREIASGRSVVGGK